MRRARRGFEPAFHTSGEDSFVAVVVTKLTGALLFILLLSMVIMALVPKASDAPDSSSETTPPTALEITTPFALPEAIVGRPYQLAFAARGGNGPTEWSLLGDLPDGLRFDTREGRITGSPRKGATKPIELTISVMDGSDRAAAPVQLAILEPGQPLALRVEAWRPKLPPIPWKTWAEHGLGFLFLLLVGWLGVGTIDRLASSRSDGKSTSSHLATGIRFRVYKWIIRASTVAAMIILASWLVRTKP
jgi:hypothetical protein